MHLFNQYITTIANCLFFEIFTSMLEVVKQHIVSFAFDKDFIINTMVCHALWMSIIGGFVQKVHKFEFMTTIMIETNSESQILFRYKII